ncbi:TraR/DksA family transcriptional regulator [Chitinophaga nivalis]|uniref:TraR/DksA C4-type zinc finger protein n=1 Tax=Chitinophaga nivalis TaxID=2991709 RepID=A0ABT3IU85_9BACT|nr:TraR/DksA C4-type zinc finger protein [Chitinophaga nivalis]MCW3462778.1 TraR/DksA C4-type zinc finger protein [Chitinophaga nivalis]MCW3487532.1 TraR/DksA C4-type zinc finger protein [Chitinophaga nivalis]
MATKKKVASKSTQKVAQAKKTVAKKASAVRKVATKPAPARKAEPTPKKAAAKKAAAKVVKPAASKAVVVKTPAKKAAPAPKAVEKKASVVQKSKTSPVKNIAVPAKSTVKKEPAGKQQVVTNSVAAEKEKPLISKSEEKELKTMAVKKADTKDQVAKEKESAKKAAEKPVVKPEKSVKAADKSEKTEKAEKSEKTEKKGAKGSLVTYQPEFTKSVLDQPEPSSGPVYRYSDADLQEFRELIQKKLESAKKELIYLQGLITRKDEAGTDDTENKYMSMEDGSGSQEREQLNQMASRQIQFIDHLEKAMMRIENKTYGICRVTGKLIDKARLRAVPHATLSIEAKLAKSK